MVELIVGILETRLYIKEHVAHRLTESKSEAVARHYAALPPAAGSESGAR